MIKKTICLLLPKHLCYLLFSLSISTSCFSQSFNNLDFEIINRKLLPTMWQVAGKGQILESDSSQYFSGKYSLLMENADSKQKSMIVSILPFDSLSRKKSILVTGHIKKGHAESNPVIMCVLREGNKNILIKQAKKQV